MMGLILGNNNSAGQVNHGDIAALNGAAALTICCWRFTDIVASPGDTEKGATAFLWMGNRELHASELPTWNRYTDVYQIPTLVWTHHACVFDGSRAAADRIKFYAEAVEQTTTGSTAGTTLLDTTGSALIIAPANVAGDWAHLRCWTQALTPADIALEMYSYWARQRSGLVLDCPYDDGVLARDYSGNGNHGTTNGAIQRAGPPISYGGKVLVTG